MTLLNDTKAVEEAKQIERNFKTGYLEADRGYKFRTREFLEIIFLYKNSVDVSNPDLLGLNNKNTFINEAVFAIKKIKEQVRIDVKDVNFLVHSASMGRFIMRGANRKMLKDNRFAKEVDAFADAGVDYGSGIFKVWQDKDGKQKMKAKTPYRMIFDQYNFTAGPKIEMKRTTARAIMADGNYDATARATLTTLIGGDEKKMDEPLILRLMVKPNKEKGGNDLYVVDVDNDLVYFKYEADQNVEYYKWDYEKRDGFVDAMGKGVYEQIFNIIVQTKTNQKRLDNVLTIASKLAFQKEIDHKNDKLVGKQITKLKDGQVVGHKGKPMEVLDTGGSKQVAMLSNELEGLTRSGIEALGVTDALAGNTLPSGTSGVLGNLLTENASSVHKEAQKAMAEVLTLMYDDKFNDYLLSVFDANESLEKYLTPSDLKLVKQNVIDYMVLQKQIDAAAFGEEFNEMDAREEVKSQLKDKKFIPGEMLQQLRDDVKGIDTLITGEKVSKAKSVAFLREMRDNYQANPEAFVAPFNIALLKKEAHLEAGISELEVDQLLKELIPD